MSLGRFVVVAFLAIVVLGLIFGGGEEEETADAPASPVAADAEPESAAAEQEAPEPAPVEPEPSPIELSGTGSTATDFFELESGLAVLDMAHQGEANFFVNLLDESGADVGYAIGNEIGTAEVSQAIQIPAAGRYVIDVDADGPWNVRVKQPRPTDAPSTTSFSGANDVATAPFTASAGLKRISATHQGEGNFFVHMLDKDGNAVGYALVNEIGVSEASTTVTVPEDGVYLFNVQAGGPWTLEIQ